MKKLIAGNWKMNLDETQAEELALALKQEVGTSQSVDVLICPSYVFLQKIKNVLKDSVIMLSAQDCSPEEKGAFTGDISAPMLKSVGCSHVIVGHSERRQGHGESSVLVKKKAKSALANGLKAIICVGETLEEREQGIEKDVMAKQLMESLPSESTDESVVIAYEPVWAIGTGKTASVDDIADMHKFIREKLTELPGGSSRIRLLYGGSVKGENAADILKTPNVDGALVGGASLKPEQFLTIIKEAVA